MEWVYEFGIGRLMHVLDLVWSLRVDRPSGQFLTFFRSLIHISNLCWQLSLLEWICVYLDLIIWRVRPRIIYHLLIQSLLVLLKVILVLSLESHLHLFVRLRYQLSQLPQLHRVSHLVLVLSQLPCEGLIEPGKALLLWDVIQKT